MKKRNKTSCCWEGCSRVKGRSMYWKRWSGADRPRLKAKMLIFKDCLLKSGGLKNKWRWRSRKRTGYCRRFRDRRAKHRVGRSPWDRAAGWVRGLFDKIKWTFKTLRRNYSWSTQNLSRSKHCSRGSPTKKGICTHWTVLKKHWLRKIIRFWFLKTGYLSSTTPSCNGRVKMKNCKSSSR